MKLHTRHRTYHLLIALYLTYGLAKPCRAEGVFFTREAVLKDFFRDSQRVTYQELTVDDALTAQLGYKPAKAKYVVFVASTESHVDGYAVIDEERGQHLPITFATQFAPDGRLQRTEVMVYREAYGEEIREARFRKQFVGKSVGQLPPKLTDDIVAVSGATISSRAMAVAVHRAAALIARLRSTATQGLPQ